MRKADVRPIVLPPGRRVLVISDIHGNLPLLKGLLDRVGLCREDILIFLGDFLERSLGGLETLRYVMKLYETYTVYSVLGNCDDVILSFMDRSDTLAPGLYGQFMAKWGEKWTPVQMARLAGLELGPPEEKPEVWEELKKRFRPELDFLRSLPQIYENEHYIFVHGGVPRETNLGELSAHGCMKNDDFLNQGHAFRRWVVVGHWPVTLYDPRIPSAAPIVDYDRHIASIDGGCTLKWDGQLNALILPEKPGGEFTWESFDGLPTATALDRQEANEDSLNIRWSERQVTVLNEGKELTRCRHNKTGREMDILTDYLYEEKGAAVCEDSTDYRLPVEPGDTLSVVRRLSDRTLCKKDGVTGWYFGRLSG